LIYAAYRILYNLRKAADYTPDQLQRTGNRLYELGGGELKHLLGITTAEKARYSYGLLPDLCQRFCASR